MYKRIAAFGKIGNADDLLFDHNACGLTMIQPAWRTIDCPRAETVGSTQFKQTCLGIEQQYVGGIHTQLICDLREYDIQGEVQVKTAADHFVYRMQGVDTLKSLFGLPEQACAVNGVAGDLAQDG